MLRVAPSTEQGQAGLRDAKLALRLRVLAERDRLPLEDRRAAGLAIVTALVARADYARARTLLLTLPFGSEWDTRPLLEAALAHGKVVALPRVNLQRRLLDLCLIGDPALDVAPGYRGIPEPRSHCTPIDPSAIDWALVPGVAFDADGRRLGYGGGYYDRLLPRLRPDAHRIAGALDVQVVDRVPAAAHDLAVDAVVTPTRTLLSNRAQG